MVCRVVGCGVVNMGQLKVHVTGQEGGFATKCNVDRSVPEVCNMGWIEPDVTIVKFVLGI